MSESDFRAQLLAAQDSGFEKVYRKRRVQLRETGKLWLQGGVPVDIVAYEIIKRLWLEFCKSSDSLCISELIQFSL